MATHWPDLATLELLLLVDERGSIGRAATDFGISQASASRRLDTLERTLGVPLLDRTTAGTRLTPQGVVVIDWVRGTLEAASDLMTGVTALRRQRAATLRVAASMTIAEYLVPGWLTAFRRARPDVEVGLDVVNSEAVGEMVASRRIDIGFIESPSIAGGLAHRQVAMDEMRLVVAPGHPWARRRFVSTGEIAATPLVVREPGSGTRTALEDVIGPARMVEPLLELPSNAAVKVAVESGAAPAVLSALAVADAVHEGRLVTPPTDLVVTRALQAVWPADRRLSPPAAGLLRIAEAMGEAATQSA
jgi:DNA-binding transcriptional LysR family regulator